MSHRKDLAKQAKKGGSLFTPPTPTNASAVGVMSQRIKDLESELADLRKTAPLSPKKAERRAKRIKQLASELERLYGWLNDYMDAETYDAPTVEVSAPKAS